MKAQQSKQSQDIAAILELVRHFDEKAEKLKKDLKAEYESCTEETNLRLNQLETDVAGIKKQLDDITTIRVNGSVGLKDVLISLYNTTTELRESQQLKKLISNYTRTHKVLGFLIHSKMGKIVVIMTILFAFLSILHAFIPSIDPIGYFVNFFKFLVKFHPTV